MVLHTYGETVEDVSPVTAGSGVYRLVEADDNSYLR